MRKLVLSTLILVLNWSVAGADTTADIDGIAMAIEQNYFDPVRASAIAGDLRDQVRSGRFSAITDRDQLAKELTKQLRAIDRHFQVRSTAPQTRVRSERTSEARRNYGFKKVARLEGNIGLVELAFAATLDFKDPASPSRQAADAVLALVQGADAVILDVRDNGGGDPAMVGYMVSAFVDPEVDVYNAFHTRGTVENERPAIAYAAPMVTVPLYVLTNRGTASAAESIAFTLQAAKRATIVGERTAGAANPGDFFRTAQGYLVFVSTGSPRNPINGRNWEGDGVKPDVKTTSAAALARAQELALERIVSESADDGVRNDARSALELLKRVQ